MKILNSKHYSDINLLLSLFLTSRSLSDFYIFIKLSETEKSDYISIIAVIVEYIFPLHGFFFLPQMIIIGRDLRVTFDASSYCCEFSGALLLIVCLFFGRC